eukprot:TRINITY_DN47837_c0_g1_i1.p1 TRINITY_DN47837_c0_g1~~TRINITY_DN47837_c0_g1_i1.p1  ORF type:complete len:498 (+),score=97.39 TRINITY_DN47837_c0_g1_i1:72-1565(+)
MSSAKVPAPPPRRGPSRGSSGGGNQGCHQPAAGASALPLTPPPGQQRPAQTGPRAPPSRSSPRASMSARGSGRTETPRDRSRRDIGLASRGGRSASSAGLAAPFRSTDAALARAGARLRRKASRGAPSETEAVGGEEDWLRPFTQRPQGPPPLPQLNQALRLPEGDQALDRLFVTHPRTAPFSHRPILSTRHPYLRYVLLEEPLRAQQAHQQKRPPRRRQQEVSPPSTRAQRLQPHSQSHMAEEERKWADLGHLFDVIALEDEVQARRTELLTAQPFVEAVDRLWAEVVPQRQRRLAHDAYLRLHNAFWATHVAPGAASDADLVSPRQEQRLLRHAMLQSGAADWIVDSAGQEGVSYEHFQMSMFELADNWVDLCTPEPYAAFVTELAAMVRQAEHVAEAPCAAASPPTDPAGGSPEPPPPPPEPAPRVADPKATVRMSWPQKRDMIIANFQNGLFGEAPNWLCRLRRRPNSQLVEHYVTPMRELSEIGKVLGVCTP